LAGEVGTSNIERNPESGILKSTVSKIMKPKDGGRRGHDGSLPLKTPAYAAITHIRY